MVEHLQRAVVSGDGSEPHLDGRREGVTRDVHRMVSVPMLRSHVHLRHSNNTVNAVNANKDAKVSSEL